MNCPQCGDDQPTSKVEFTIETGQTIRLDLCWACEFRLKQQRALNFAQDCNDRPMEAQAPEGSDDHMRAKVEHMRLWRSNRDPMSSK